MVVPEMLILLSGPVAVGKTTLRQILLSEHGFEYVRSSGYLRQLLEDRGDIEDRTTLQNLGDELDRQTDFRWLLDEVATPAFSASPAQQRWLVDAVRKHRQVEHFRASYGVPVLHVHLRADEAVLRARYSQRADATPYEVAVQHENEIAARSLIDIADLVIDTGLESAEHAADRVLGAAALRRNARV